MYEIDMLSKEKNDVYNLKESCIQNNVGGQHAVDDKIKVIDGKISLNIFKKQIQDNGDTAGS